MVIPVPPRTRPSTPPASTGTSTSSTSSTASSTAPRPVAATRPPVSADRVERAATATSAERTVVRNAARPQVPPPPSRTAPAAENGVSSTERRRLVEQGGPNVQRAVAAHEAAQRAEGRLAVARGQQVVQGFRDAMPFMRDTTPAERATTQAAVQGAAPEAQRLRAEANRVGRAAMADVRAPADRAISESRTAQDAARTANTAAEAAQARVTTLQQQLAHNQVPLAERNDMVAQARAQATQARVTADAANRTALEKGDAALAAQQRANRTAEAMGQPLPYASADTVKTTLDATRLSPDAQRRLLGAPAGMSTDQAQGAHAGQARDRAEAAITRSGDAQRAAQAAHQQLDAATSRMQAAERAVAEGARNNAAPDDRRNLQRNLETARADVLKLDRDAERADLTARTAGDAAIRAQQEANSAARDAGRAPPFADADGIRNTTDAASLSPATQKKLLGDVSTVTQAQAIEADLATLRTGSPEERAAALETIMRQDTPAAYKDAFLAESADEVKAIAVDALRTNDADRAGTTMDSMARAMDAAGGTRSDALQQQWQAGVDQVVMSPQAAMDIARQEETVGGHRNAQITDGYHQFSEQTALTLGRENANWTTYGQWASAGAGQAIRGNIPGNATEQFLATKGLGVDTDKAIRATADGNQAIWADIGPAMAANNRAVLGDPRWRTDPSRMPDIVDKGIANAEAVTGKPMGEGLQGALHTYGDAALIRARDPVDQRALAQTIYKGSVEIAAHEQDLAQPFLSDVLQDTTRGNILGAVPGMGDASEEATERIEIGFGRGLMHVSDDVQGAVPRDLQSLDDKGLESRIVEWNDGKPYGDRRHSDASDWKNYGERMGFISHVFAANQQGNSAIWGHPAG